jgi:hypothetical protein
MKKRRHVEGSLNYLNDNRASYTMQIECLVSSTFAFDLNYFCVRMRI